MPIVIRGPQGGGHRLSAQHSQSLEAWFTAVPGLKVVMPSTPHDAKGLLLAPTAPAVLLVTRLSRRGGAIMFRLVGSGS